MSGDLYYPNRSKDRTPTLTQIVNSRYCRYCPKKYVSFSGNTYFEHYPETMRGWNKQPRCNAEPQLWKRCLQKNSLLSTKLNRELIEFSLKRLKECQISLQTSHQCYADSHRCRQPRCGWIRGDRYRQGWGDHRSHFPSYLRDSRSYQR